jgi:DNA-binding NtrC family response regulator
VDVRVIAGTNRDLAAEVARSTFRQDLLYRLQVVEVVVPPLRERRDDIEALAQHFLASIAERSGHLPKHLCGDAIACMLEYDWPGNVRELEHTLEAAAVYSEGEEIRATDLPIFNQLFQQRGKRALTQRGNRGPGNGGPPRTGLREALEDLERQRLLETLAQNENNKTRAARALGMSRGALLRRLKRYQL